MPAGQIISIQLTTLATIFQIGISIIFKKTVLYELKTFIKIMASQPTIHFRVYNSAFYAALQLPTISYHSANKLF